MLLSLMIDAIFQQRLLTTFVNRLFIASSFEPDFPLIIDVDGKGKNIIMPDGIRFGHSHPTFSIFSLFPLIQLIIHIWLPVFHPISFSLCSLFRLFRIHTFSNQNATYIFFVSSDVNSSFSGWRDYRIHRLHLGWDYLTMQRSFCWPKEVWNITGWFHPASLPPCLPHCLLSSFLAFLPSALRACLLSPPSLTTCFPPSIHPSLFSSTHSFPLSFLEFSRTRPDR